MIVLALFFLIGPLLVFLAKIVFFAGIAACLAKALSSADSSPVNPSNTSPIRRSVRARALSGLLAVEVTFVPTGI